ncbi:MAG: radical SAM protein [Deltaproteobacteria bacterium]|nr:radical SAM protein [Deltaproteobacteria bacterium]
MRYTDLQVSGELRRRAEGMDSWLQHCVVCPHECGTDRTKEAGAFCQATDRVRIVSFGPHFGEERPLVGRGGSGTIFFGRCNLRCVYCQNYDISQADSGTEIGPEALADIMLQVQKMGCENINLVSPTHFTPQILKALLLAAAQGLHLPLVWNTGTFERLATLRMLEGVVDIYLPDTKYADPQVAQRLSGTADYPRRMREALREMHRQVGDLVTDHQGVAVRGIIVRHLVLPGGLAGTAEIMRFIAEELSPDTYVNVMGQYRPEYRAGEYPEIARSVTVEEVAEGRRLARAAGLRRLDC